MRAILLGLTLRSRQYFTAHGDSPEGAAQGAGQARRRCRCRARAIASSRCERCARTCARARISRLGALCVARSRRRREPMYDLERPVTAPPIADLSQLAGPPPPPLPPSPLLQVLVRLVVPANLVLCDVQAVMFDRELRPAQPRLRARISRRSRSRKIPIRCAHRSLRSMVLRPRSGVPLLRQAAGGDAQVRGRQEEEAGGGPEEVRDLQWSS